MKAGLAKFDERFHDHQVSQVIQTNQATIEFKEKHLLQLDGEVIGTMDRIDANMLKGAIYLLSTQDNPYIL